MRACVKTAHGGIRERLSAQVSHDRVREMMSGKTARGGDLKIPVSAVQTAGRIMPPRRSITAAVHISEEHDRASAVTAYREPEKNGSSGKAYNPQRGENRPQCTPRKGEALCIFGIFKHRARTRNAYKGGHLRRTDDTFHPSSDHDLFEPAPVRRGADMMLSAVIAIAVSEGEKWGAVCGLISSLLISSVGTTGFSVIPLVYMLTGYISGLLSRYYLRQNAVIRLIYQLCAGFLRAAATLMMLHAHMAHFTFTEVLTGTLLPEYFSTLAVSPLVQTAVWISLKAFHRTRAERTDTPSDL